MCLGMRIECKCAWIREGAAVGTHLGGDTESLVFALCTVVEVAVSIHLGNPCVLYECGAECGYYSYSYKR